MKRLLNCPTLLTKRRTLVAIGLLTAASLFASAQTTLAVGINQYDISSGLATFIYDPTLSGGDFGGQTFSSLSISDFAGIRDSASAQVVLLGPSGLTQYDISSGLATFLFNPTLSGGDFNGQTFSSLSISDFAGIRDSASAQVVLRGPSGLTQYDISSGLATFGFNPTLSGGDFGGQTFSSLSSSDYAGIRDSASAQVLLFSPVPEPSSLLLAGMAITGLGCLVLRRHRQFTARKKS